ncbi:MAG TPA: hypothetical protein VF297_30090 [Pyrinomonadaceae bacterium]
MLRRERLRENLHINDRRLTLRLNPFHTSLRDRTRHDCRSLFPTPFINNLNNLYPNPAPPRRYMIQRDSLIRRRDWLNRR